MRRGRGTENAKYVEKTKRRGIPTLRRGKETAGHNLGKENACGETIRGKKIWEGSREKIKEEEEMKTAKKSAYKTGRKHPKENVLEQLFSCGVFHRSTPPPPHPLHF